MEKASFELRIRNYFRNNLLHIFDTECRGQLFNTLASCSGGAVFKPRRGHRLTEGFHDFSSVPAGKYRESTLN
jgi:hypothetical protein